MTDTKVTIERDTRDDMPGVTIGHGDDEVFVPQETLRKVANHIYLAIDTINREARNR